MDWTAIGVGVTVVGGLIGWLYTGMKGDLSNLRGENKSLSDRLQHHEVTVARDYALRDDLEKLAKAYKEDLDKLMVAMFAKLDRIESKLDQKVDKP